METQTRGSADTLTRALVGLEPPRRLFVVALAIAVVVHLPALPTPLSMWLSLLIPDPDPEPLGPQQQLVLPIDIDLLAEEPAPSATAEPGPAPAPAAEPLGHEPTGDEDLEGMFDEPSEPSEPSEPAPASEPPPVDGEEPPEAPPPPPPDPAPPPPPPPRVTPGLPEGKLRDAFAAAGEAGSVRARHPNVNVYIAADVLRQRELSRSFSDLLVDIPQWQELIGGTGLDPLQDFDRILISGPQFRNPKWIVVAIRFNTTAARVKKALDSVVQRSGKAGAWLDPLTAVIGKGGDRYAVLVPEKRTLWILPASQKDDLERVRGAGAFARTPAAGIVIDIKKPANAFRGAPFAFPKSITHMRVHFALAAGDGYRVVAEGWDESHSQAVKHATFLEQAVDALDMSKKVDDVSLLPDAVKSWVKKKNIRAVGDTKFTVQGKRIVATASVSDRQIERIMDLIRMGLDQRAAAADRSKAAAADGKRDLERTERFLNRMKELRAAKRAAADAGEAEEGTASEAVSSGEPSRGAAPGSASADQGQPSPTEGDPKPAGNP